MDYGDSPYDTEGAFPKWLLILFSLESSWLINLILLASMMNVDSTGQDIVQLAQYLESSSSIYESVHRTRSRSRLESIGSHREEGDSPTL